jgi:hypothetical protein
VPGESSGFAVDAAEQPRTNTQVNITLLRNMTSPVNCLGLIASSEPHFAGKRCEQRSRSDDASMPRKRASGLTVFFVDRPSCWFPAYRSAVKSK